MSPEDARRAIAEAAHTLAERVRRHEILESGADSVLRAHAEHYSDSYEAAWSVYDHGLAIFQEDLRAAPPAPTKRDAFHTWLDLYWPLWRQHQGGVRYNDLKAAFEKGRTCPKVK